MLYLLCSSRQEKPGINLPKLHKTCSWGTDHVILFELTGLNIILGARKQNIGIQEEFGRGRSLWLLHLLSEHMFPTVTQAEICWHNRYCNFIELTLQIPTFHPSSLKEKAMCAHPLNYIIGSLKSFLLPFLLLIFTSKQIFQTIFNLILNHGSERPKQVMKEERVTHQITKLSGCILPRWQKPVSVSRENECSAGLGSKRK